MTNYSLSSILNALTKHKKGATPCVSKRLIFNKGTLGGISSIQLILFFIALPFIEYAAIFNPYVFGALGIAQSIVVFIVFLVFLMQMVFVMIWRNNKNVLSKVSSSWESYFPGIDLKLVLSSGVSPYNDFYKAYCEAEASTSNDEELRKALSDAFKLMQEENRDLLDAIEKDKNS
jgi:hypothetical protein